MIPLLAAGVAGASVGCAKAERQIVTLAIVNARVWTGDSASPWAEAIAVSGEHIAAVGTTATIRDRLPASARVVDANGAMVTPGFIDSHVHFNDGGFALASVQLRDAKTRQEFIQRIAGFAKTLPKGTWIRNGDWDHTNWGGELPTRAWIDSVTPDNPVWINRLDGHMNLANALAIAAANIDRRTKDIEGGTIVRDARGEPTGVFKDNAKSLIDAVQPPRGALWTYSRGHEKQQLRWHESGNLPESLHQAVFEAPAVPLAKALESASVATSIGAVRRRRVLMCGLLGGKGG